MENAPESLPKNLPREKSSSGWFIKFTPAIMIFTFLIFIFSIFMSGLASYREGISAVNYQNVERIYGSLTQEAPTLNKLEDIDGNYALYKITPELAEFYLQNTNLVSTNGEVKITADFVKKGLVYQPTYKTEFSGEFTLKNSLDKEAVISFDFPFPSGTSNSEISNAQLVADGVVFTNAKSVIKSTTGQSQRNGLRWEGKIAANGEVKIGIKYNTVGLSQFSYEGIENTKDPQNFNFKINIIGTRAYDILDGLSVDKREFGQDQVSLIWEKNNLYSKPVVNVTVGNKINPSEQVSRVYTTMTPIYLIFIISLIVLSRKFAKEIKVADVSILSVLFIVFFPFFHYLSSFTVDPTTEIFANTNVIQYSMPLYTAFLLAFLLIGGIMFYLISRVLSRKFALKLGLPLIVLAIGFFPLVATIPEYFILLTLIGLITIMAIVIQVRVSSQDSK